MRLSIRRMLDLLPILAFAGLLVFAALSDGASLTIPNWVSIALALIFPLAAVSANFSWAEIGIHYLFGFGVLVVAFFLFQANVFGGGDAKLIAAVSIWTGFASFGPFALYTTLAGGLMAAGLLFARKWAPVIPGAPNFVNRLLDSKSGIPYGVAIMVGALAALPDMAVAPATLTLP